ncbi:helix-turn-helix domain-containing protein [Aquimarina spongiae]|uniref:AraC-type DNA-binding protein n=1 Tax=Aquimarina spongiae TaxID=570521 RepID=A0A1M6JJX8_9FLAO|nr:helix-turn-helix domain-containing protein [Aquimarina spongiae]SHJ46932.1 AraC-type DNA-binding protein [Aquimarina spongiae]
MQGPSIRFVDFFSCLFFLLLGIHYTFGQEESLERAEQYYQKGKTLYHEEAYKESVAVLDKVVKIAQEVNDSLLLCKAVTAKGTSYLMNDQNQKALDAYYKALEIAKALKNYDRELVANSGLVLVYKKTNQYDKALALSKEILQSIDKSSYKNTKNHVRTITVSIEVYLDTEQYDSVLHYAEQGITLSKSLDFKEGLVDLYIKKGVVFYHRDEYENALNILFKAEEILQTNEVKNKFYPTINCAYFIASCYYKQGKYDQAITRLLDNIKASEQKDLFNLPVLQSHLLLANCYAAQQDFESALLWNTKYVELNEANQKRKTATINKIYQKEAQVLQKGIVDLQDAHRKNERIKTYGYFLAILLFIILFIGAVLYFKKQKTYKLRFDRLLQKIDDLETKEHEVTDKKETTKPILIDDEKVMDVLKGLERLEAQEYYLRLDCNLRSVAKKVKTNSTYLSKIVNIHRQKNFNEYIRDLRIEYVLKRLKNDKKFRSFSIKSIANEIGYKSDYSFAKHFKAKTGLNPSYYIKNLQKQEKSIENMIS